MNILAISTILLLILSLICGLWIRSQPENDPSAITYHMGLGIMTVLVGLATSVLALIR